jgi:hypothetical protein
MAGENNFDFHYALDGEWSGILSPSGRAFRVHNIYFDTRSISKWEFAIKDMTDFQKFQKPVRRGRGPCGTEAA